MGRVFVAGSVNMDVVATADRHPRIGETVAGDAVRYFPGGKGANQAVAAARLGASTALIGRLGKDAFGDELRMFLASQGVDLTFVRETSGVHSGTAIITLANADNTIVVIPGANALVSAADVAAYSVRGGRYRGQPVRDSPARDHRLLQTGPRGRRDHHPQSGAGRRIRPPVARSHRYPDPQ